MLTVANGRKAAYPTEVRVIFAFRRSAMIWAPSASSELPLKLRATSKWKCQGVLTTRKGAAESVHQLLKRRVRLESLAQRLCAFGTNVVTPEAASESQIGVSARADSREMGVGGVLQRGEGLVLFETLSEVLGALSTNGIQLQTARRSGAEVSGRADSE